MFHFVLFFMLCLVLRFKSPLFELFWYLCRTELHVLIWPKQILKSLIHPSLPKFVNGHIWYISTSAIANIDFIIYVLSHCYTFMCTHYLFWRCHPIGAIFFYFLFFNTNNNFIKTKKKTTKMLWAGFEPLTLGVASSDEDHFTMPLPLFFNILNQVKW